MDEATVVAAEQMILTCERGLVWPRQKTLFIADAHFGKGNVFRRNGMAIPPGTTRADLDRLKTVALRHRVERIVVLGDFFHARPEPEEQWLKAFRQWRSEHSQMSVDVIRGNHDPEELPAALDGAFSYISDARWEPPFVLGHHPQPDPRGHVLSGHLHPGMRLGTAEKLRLPVFWCRNAVTVLPAFGSFTGLQLIRPDADDRVFGVGPCDIVSIL